MARGRCCTACACGLSPAGGTAFGAVVGPSGEGRLANPVAPLSYRGTAGAARGGVTAWKLAQPGSAAKAAASSLPRKAPFAGRRPNRTRT